MLTLGNWASDKITGFGGILTGRAEYLTGCTQYCVQPIAINNDFKEAKWFDEDRLVDNGQAVKAETVTGKDKGGPSGSAPIK